ncbi:MAG: DNA-processing protein DprA [Pseudomonadota bacterium]
MRRVTTEAPYSAHIWREPDENRATGGACARFSAMSEGAELCLRGSSLPGRLSDLAAPPEQLFLRGELPRVPGVAIVGTREASREAADYAFELARELAEAGIAVLSGGAQGIDTAAHRGALAGGGPTVVVAPAGFDRPFPSENAELFREVVSKGGAYLSLVEASVPATQGIFFTRNAYLVALAHLVVVAESPLRSGARNAAAHARRLNRPLFAVPFAPWHGKGRGCLAELQRGARCLMGVKDLLKELAAQNQHGVLLSRGPTPLLQPDQQTLNFSETSSPEQERTALLEAVLGGAGSADEICLLIGLRAGRVSELILTLRLEGVLVTDPCGRLQIRNSLK